MQQPNQLKLHLQAHTIKRKTNIIEVRSANYQLRPLWLSLALINQQKTKFQLEVARSVSR